MNKKILRLSVLLFAVCALVSGVLGGVNVLTESRIEEQKRLNTEKAYRQVLPAESYEELIYTGSDARIQAISRCEAGHIVTMTVGGSQGDISFVVGVDGDYRCTGISIISHSETAGLGAVAAAKNAKGESWRAQFAGQGDNMAIRKDGGHIDAISGATITSRALTEGAADAIRAVKELQ